MASVITVRNLDPAVKEKIRQRAHRHGRSMEAEIRAILAAAPLEDPEPRDFVWAVDQFQESISGLDLADLTLERLPDTEPRGATLFVEEPPT